MSMPSYGNFIMCHKGRDSSDTDIYVSTVCSRDSGPASWQTLLITSILCPHREPVCACIHHVQL